MSEDDRPDRCETCRHWEHCDGLDEQNQAVSPDDAFGYCHRYPPTLDNPRESGQWASWSLPVMLRIDFCGEWKPKDAEPVLPE
jgi:hypothetical protein